jgi:hypothetical protein
MNAYHILWRDKLIAVFVNYVTTEVVSQCLSVGWGVVCVVKLVQLS